tara:strand:+ start:1328 stop:1864 length:537 start_codon:yes stop_codon:yes gene_type:complete
MVNLRDLVVNHLENIDDFNENYIERGSVYWFKNSDMVKFIKFRKRVFDDKYSIIPETPSFLIDNPEQHHPWIFLKRYQVSSKKTKKATLGVRSHYEKNKKGWIHKQKSHQDIETTHKLRYLNCSLNIEGVYMNNTPIEQRINSIEMKKLISDKKSFSCVDSEVDEIHKKLNEIDETYT